MFSRNFKTPFQDGLWGLVVLIIALSGVAIWTLEVTSVHTSVDFDNMTTGQSMFMSLYLAFAHFTDTANHTPKSWQGRWMMVAWGFTVVILISSYTANLASYLTRTQGPQAYVFSSPVDAERQRAPYCIAESAADLTETYVLNKYPDVPTVKVPAPLGDTEADITRSLINQMPYGPSQFGELKSGQCKAALMTKAQWYLSESQYCDFRDTGVIKPVPVDGRAGWITHREAPCIQQAVNWAFQEVAADRFLERLLEKYKPGSPCPTWIVETSNLQKLEVKDMAGLFMIYGIILALAFGYKLLKMLKKYYHGEDDHWDGCYPGKEYGKHWDGRGTIANRRSKNKSSVQVGNCAATSPILAIFLTRVLCRLKKQT